MFEIRVFGQTEVRSGDRRLLLGDFDGAKPRQVLELLTLNRGRVVTKPHLADLLWEGAPPPGYVATLEGYVSLLRRALQPGVRPRESVVRTAQGGYLLDPALVRIDLDTFDRLTAVAAVAPQAQALEALTDAVELARGEVLAHERYASWAEEARRCYGQRLLRAATEAARRALELGDPEAAIRLAQRAADLDPLAEDAWRTVIEAQWRAGRRVEALRAYARLRNLLVRALGIEPGRATQDVHLAVLQDEPVGIPA